MAETAAEKQRPRSDHLPQVNRRQYALILIAVALFSLVLYANALVNDFLWDDNELIVDNPAVHSLANLPHFFSGHFWAASEQPTARGYYRPIVLASYAFDFALWGQNPAGFHLTNVLLHACAALLACLMILQLTAKPAAGLIAGLVFAALPVHVESVAFISGRTDVLATVFVLASFCLFLSARSNKSFSFKLPLAVLCFGFGLLSKEVAAALPALLIAVEVTMPEPPFSRKKVIFHAPYWLALAAYLALRGGLLHIRPDIQGRLSLAETLLTMPAIALDYIRLLVLPVNLCADYAVSVQRTISAGNVAALGVCAAGIMFLTLQFLRKKMSAFFLVWVLLGLLPVMQIVPISVLKAERFLYLPSAGYCGFLGLTGAGILAGAKRQRLALAALLLLLCLLSIQTIGRTTVWKDEFTLYKKTASCAPGNFRVQYNLGNAYFRRGDIERALEHTRIAQSLKPNFPQAAYNLGVMYEAAGRNEEAEKMYRRAVELNPDYAAARNNLAALLFRGGDYEGAEREWLKALALDDALPQPRQGLLLLEKQRQRQNALENR